MRRSKWRWGAIVAVTSTLAWGTFELPSANAATFAPGAGHPWNATSPFNTPIAANPQLDPTSAAVAKILSSGSHGAAIEQYGVPIYDANASTPKKAVPCSEDWGVCPTAKPVPMPANAKPAEGSDAAMVVIDWSTRIEYDYWMFSGSKTAWSAAQSIDGDGRGGGAVGAGVSRLAGVVRTYEIANGVIDHALVFSSDFSCPKTFVYPATKTDGSNDSSQSACLQEGGRVQLDPSINLDTMSGLSKADRIVGRALQTYGAYNIDNGGARMAIVMEAPFGKTDPYQAAGISDQENFNLPWDKMRVIKPATGPAAAAPATKTPVAKTPATKTTATKTPVVKPQATTQPQVAAPAQPTPTPTPAAGSSVFPNAPSRVVSAVAADGVKVSWAPTTGTVKAARYEVWRGDSNYENWRLIGTTTGSITTFTDKKAKSQTTYTYGLRAFSSNNNESGPSPRIRVTAR